MLVVEKPLLSPGLVTSERALRVLEFLEACGGAPEEALLLLDPHRPDRTRKSLASLRAGGWAYRARLDGEMLWLPRGADPPRTELEFRRQSVIGWLAARLAEAGGAYAAGAAVFSNRQAFPALVVPPDRPGRGSVLAVLLDCASPDGLPAGSLWVRAEDLRVERLERCLRRA
jgi:hypothetical protein